MVGDAYMAPSELLDPFRGGLLRHPQSDARGRLAAPAASQVPPVGLAEPDSAARLAGLDHPHHPGDLPDVPAHPAGHRRRRSTPDPRDAAASRPDERDVSSAREVRRIGMETEGATFHCGFCGEPNDTFVDLSAGSQQSYIEDCQVCCRPNVLRGERRSSFGPRLRSRPSTKE